MRVAVIHVLMQDERAAFAQPFDDDRIRLVDLHAAERAAKAHAVADVEAAVIVDRHDDRHAEFHAGKVVVNAMARCGVHDARAVFHRDVVSVDEHALFALVGEYGLLVLVALQLGARGLEALDDHSVVPAEFLDELLDERLGHDVSAPVMGDGNIRLGRMQDDGIVGW